MSSIAIAPPTSRAALSRASHSLTRGHLARVGLASIACAVLANVLVYWVGDVIIGYDPTFLELGSALGIALFTLVPAVGAVLLYAGLLRFSRHPVRRFRLISAIVFVVTTIPDFTFIPSEPGASPAQTAILVLMHAVAASLIVGMLTTLARPNQAAATTGLSRRSRPGSVDY